MLRGLGRELSGARGRFGDGLQQARSRALRSTIARQATKAANRARDSAVRAAEKAKLFERIRRAWLAVTVQLTQLPRVVGQISTVGLYVVSGSLGFLAVFLIHQLLLWASMNPAQAFENAKTFYFILELVWDTMQAILNAGFEVVNVFIPGWNAVAQKAITPVVYIVLDVLCLIFFQERYPGVISESDIPFRGFYCDPNDAGSMEFCGEFSYYYDKLYDSERSGEGVVNGSLVFSPATGRRLSDAVVTPLVPVLDMSAITGTVQLIVSVLIVVGSQIVDVALHVAYTILSELATLILDLFWTILNTVVDIFLMLVRSGLLEKLLGFAIDLTVIYYGTSTHITAHPRSDTHSVTRCVRCTVELFIPQFMYGVNMFLCIVNLIFGQNTWDAQLECAAYRSNPACSSSNRVFLYRCIEDKCFNSAEAVIADLVIFTSKPIFWGWTYNVIHAAVYSKTGRSLFGDSLTQLLPGGKGWVTDMFPALQAGGCASYATLYSNFTCLAHTPVPCQWPVFKA